MAKHTAQEKFQIAKGVVDRKVEVISAKYEKVEQQLAALKRERDALLLEQAWYAQNPLLVNQEGVSSVEGGTNNPADPGQEQAGPYPGDAPVTAPGNSWT